MGNVSSLTTIRIPTGIAQEIPVSGLQPRRDIDIRFTYVSLAFLLACNRAYSCQFQFLRPFKISLYNEELFQSRRITISIHCRNYNTRTGNSMWLIRENLVDN